METPAFACSLENSADRFRITSFTTSPTQSSTSGRCTSRLCSLPALRITQHYRTAGASLQPHHIHNGCRRYSGPHSGNPRRERGYQAAGRAGPEIRERSAFVALGHCPLTFAFSRPKINPASQMPFSTSSRQSRTTASDCRVSPLEPPWTATLIPRSRRVP